MPTYTAPTDLALLDPVELAGALRSTIEKALELELAAYDDRTAALHPAEGKWSAKEIIGHLIDSAGNNLQRIVRLSIDEELTMPGYKQEEWVAVQHYQQRHWSDLVILWSALNLHLAFVMEKVEKAHLVRVWHYVGASGNTSDITLGFIMEDYVAHMRHHLARMPKVQ